MSNYTKTTNFAAKDSLPSGNAAKIVKGTEIDTEFNNIETASATKADSNNSTLTGTTAFETLSDGSISITAFVDEDNMASDSATLLPTQQSVKAYVDSQVTAQDLDFQADTGGALSIDLDSETLTLTGGTGIDTSGALNAVTFAIDSTVATLTGSQTLSNKTLSTPVVSGNLTTDGLIDGRDVATDGTKLDGIESGATADQTAAEIKTAYESNADTNAFTDADHSKLDGIEASADVTDTANVTAAGALMDSELTSEASVKALNQGVATTDSPTFAGVTAPITGNVTGNLTGNVTGNVTGNLTGDVTGDVTGNVTGNLTGSVLTAAQTSITSVGTLGSLTVSGDVTVDTNSLKVDSTNNRVGILNASPDVTLDIGSATDSIHIPVGTTAQRPSSPAAGYFRYNSSLSQFEGYTDAWGAIGGGGTNTFTTDSFTGDGTTVAYALSQAVSSEDNLLVFIEGVFQQQDAYSIATAGGVTTLTFSAAPANGNSILIYSVAAGVSGSNLNIDSMTGDGSDTTLTLTINPVNENNTQVFIDGVYQNKSTYSISGTTLTFSTAPPNGSAVEVMTMTQTDINVPVDNSITSAKLSGDLVTPGNLDVTTGLTVDTTTLVVDATNNRVGLGTSSPASLLDVKGSTGNSVITLNSAAAIDSYPSIGKLRFYSNDNSTNSSGEVGSVEVIGVGTWNGASNNAAMTFNLIQGLAGTTSPQEAMRIDSSGNLLVGTTVTPLTLISATTGDGFGVDGDDGYLAISRDFDGAALYLNKTNGQGGTHIQFRADGSSVGSIGVAGSRPYFSNNINFSVKIDDFSNGSFTPANKDGVASDNVSDIGQSSARWDDIYATNGTIQTSDRNEKQDIQALSDAEQRVAAAAKGLLRKFRWIDSVADKGDEARIHFGIIAQDLQDAFTAEGLDAGRYAMFINSTWTDEETGEERSRMGVRYSELLAFIIAAI